MQDSHVESENATEARYRRPAVTWGCVLMLGLALVGGCGLLCWLGPVYWPHGDIPVRVLVGLPVLSVLVVHLFAGSEEGRGRSGWAEFARVGLLVGGALVLTAPYETANLVGGLDARWYLFTLMDHLEQSRAGVWPVLIGQGSYQFNGAVHPYRFGPYFHALAGVLDLATARTLTAVSLQHLTVVVSAVGFGLTSYLGLLAVNSQRRWFAWAGALAILFCPVGLGLIAVLDMYMSFMALPWLPLALGAAVLAIKQPTAFRHAGVSAALGVAWVCHAPVALWASIAVYGLLVCGWFVRGMRTQTLALIAGSALLVAVLDLAYFAGVAELTAPASMRLTWAQGVRWAALGVVGVICVYCHFKYVHRRAGRYEAPDRANALLLSLAGGALMALLMHWLWPLRLPGTEVDSFTYVERFASSAWGWVSSTGDQVSDIKPGFVFGLVLCSGLLGAIALRDYLPKIAGLVLLVVMLVVVPMTPLSKAVWALLPEGLILSTSGAPSLRIFPVFSVLVIFLGFSASVGWRSPNRVWTLVAAAAGVLALLATVTATLRFQRFLKAMTYSADQTELFTRSENAPLFIYSGNFIGIPEYFSHGVRDYKMESRILDSKSEEESDDLLVNNGPVPRDSEKSMKLMATPSTVVPGWWDLSEKIRLPPGTRVVARFEAVGERPKGILVFDGPGLYREYLLPSSGNPRAFGLTPGNSPDVPLWNSGSAPFDVTMRFRPDEAWTGAEVRLFARFAVCPRSDEELRVRTVGLVPEFHAWAEVRGPALLETPRTWIPGYIAVCNGRPTQVIRTKRNLVGVGLSSGENEVRVTFMGSPRLRVSWFFSLAAWTGLAFWATCGCSAGEARPSISREISGNSDPF